MFEAVGCLDVFCRIANASVCAATLFGRTTAAARGPCGRGYARGRPPVEDPRTLHGPMPTLHVSVAEFDELPSASRGAEKLYKCKYKDRVISSHVFVLSI